MNNKDFDSNTLKNPTDWLCKLLILLEVNANNKNSFVKYFNSGCDYERLIWLYLCNVERLNCPQNYLKFHNFMQKTTFLNNLLIPFYPYKYESLII